LSTPKSLEIFCNLSLTPSLDKGRGNVGERGAKPLSKISSPSPFEERDTNGESKRGGASLLNPSPFPLPRGRGIKGDGVTK